MLSICVSFIVGLLGFRLFFLPLFLPRLCFRRPFPRFLPRLRSFLDFLLRFGCLAVKCKEDDDETSDEAGSVLAKARRFSTLITVELDFMFSSLAMFRTALLDCRFFKGKLSEGCINHRQNTSTAAIFIVTDGSHAINVLKRTLQRPGKAIGEVLLAG